MSDSIPGAVIKVRAWDHYYGRKAELWTENGYKLDYLQSNNVIGECIIRHTYTRITRSFKSTMWEKKGMTSYMHVFWSSQIRRRLARVKTFSSIDYQCKAQRGACTWNIMRYLHFFGLNKYAQGVISALLFIPMVHPVTYTVAFRP